MYQRNSFRNYGPTPNGNPYGDRFAGGFAVPFVLGGITGGLLAPAFYPRPMYTPYPGPMMPGPYPVYYR